jgi:hypothetical protein
MARAGHFSILPAGEPDRKFKTIIFAERAVVSPHSTAGGIFPALPGQVIRRHRRSAFLAI